MLANANRIVLAFDVEKERVVGFINALTDHVLTAYIPLLEVLPDYRRQGIGAELVRRMLEGLRDLYMVDLLCDPALQPFYRRLGMLDASGMMIRNHARQRTRRHRPSPVVPLSKFLSSFVIPARCRCRTII